MSSNKCPFSTLQAAGLSACEMADHVVRRGGSEYDCTRADAHQRCAALSRHLLDIGLPALGYEDDLGTTPKSAYDRALIGGLQGLATLLPDNAAALHASNIHGLLEATLTADSDPASLPADVLVRGIENYRPARRRGRAR
jgi:hypothetical protein